MNLKYQVTVSLHYSHKLYRTQIQQMAIKEIKADLLAINSTSLKNLKRTSFQEVKQQKNVYLYQPLLYGTTTHASLQPSLRVVFFLHSVDKHSFLLRFRAKTHYFLFCCYRQMGIISVLRRTGSCWVRVRISYIQGSKLRLTGCHCDQKLSAVDKIFTTGRQQANQVQFGNTG